MTQKMLGSLLVISALAWSSLAVAAAPALLTQQGRLFDAAGTPKTDTVAIAFNIYADATGGTSQWTETDSVTLDQGYFSVQLGGKTALPATLWDGSTKYIGVTVGTDPEMTPRQAVTSVPYAVMSNDATGDIHPTSITVGTTKVVDSSGAWVGPAPACGTATGTLLSDFNALGTRVTALEQANNALTVASGTNQVLTTSQDGAYNTCLSVTTAGTWLVQGQASLFTQANTDAVRLGLCYSLATPIANSMSPTAITPPLGTIGGVVTSSSVALSTAPVLVPVTSPTTICLCGYRNGVSQLVFGNPSPVGSSMAANTQRITAIQLTH